MKIAKLKVCNNVYDFIAQQSRLEFRLEKKIKSKPRPKSKGQLISE